MARKCKHKWDSFVNDEPDDEIEVENTTARNLQTVAVGDKESHGTQRRKKHR